MPECVNLSLGGIPISLIPDQVSGEYRHHQRAIEFLTPAAPEVILQVHCGWFPEFSEQSVVFETEIAWQMLQADGNYVINVCSPGVEPYQVGVFPPDFRSGDIYIALHEGNPDSYVFPLSYPMGELYLMNLLGTGRGILFHATGVIDQGKGYLFIGHGGAGKSTTARLWQELPDVKVVSDDKVIVRKEAGKFRLYGTPWPGEGGMALPDSAPLSRVFILRQATENVAVPLYPVQAVSSLLARAFVPLWDANKIAFSLKFLEELCQTIPCLELGFLADSSAIDFVRNLP